MARIRKFKGIRLFMTKDLMERTDDQAEAIPLLIITKSDTGSIRVKKDKSREKLAGDVFNLFKDVRSHKNKTMEEDPGSWFHYMVARTNNQRFITIGIEEPEENPQIQYELDL